MRRPPKTIAEIFVEATDAASLLIARDWLERHDGDLARAIDGYLGAHTRPEDEDEDEEGVEEITRDDLNRVMSLMVIR